MLYGLAQARSTIAEQGTAIVSEGYMDVIALHRAGFGHAVAPLGTALTEQQIEMLWRMAPEPIICLDGDAAGRRAALRAAERAMPLLKPGFSLRFATLPPTEDPDSLIKSTGPAAMRAVLDAAKPLSEIVWTATLASHSTDTPERKAALEKDLIELADRIADIRVREEYRRFFGADARTIRTGLDPGARSWPRTGPRRAGAIGRRTPARRGPAGGARESRAERERMLLFPLIVHPPLIEIVAERLGSLHLVDSGMDNLRQALLNTELAVQGLDSRALQDYVRATGLAQVLNSLLAANAHETWPRSSPAVVAEKAAAVWADALRLFVLTDLAEDIHLAEARYAQDPSEGNLAHLMGLKAEQDFRPARRAHGRRDGVLV